jgi:hypothetical protein
MRPRAARTSMKRWVRYLASGVVSGAILLGCGSAATGTATPSEVGRSAVPPTPSSAAVASASSAAIASASPAPSRSPATATLTFAGATGLAGAVTKPAIRCSQPSFDGLAIDIFAQPADPAVLDRITVTDGKVTVRVAAGAGSAYTERDFAGTGVTGFDVATGAQIDTTLTETTAAGLNPGTLGAITSLKGTIACNDQRPGSSTLVISGDISEGSFTGVIDPVNVKCSADGTDVSILGLAMAGTTPVLLVINVPKDHFTIAAAPKGGTGHLYAANGPGVASVSATGAHLAGDATAQQGGPNAIKLHLAGDATCG